MWPLSSSGGGGKAVVAGQQIVFAASLYRHDVCSNFLSEQRVIYVGIMLSNALKNRITQQIFSFTCIWFKIWWLIFLKIYCFLLAIVVNIFLHLIYQMIKLYCLSKKSWSKWYGNLLYKMGQYFSDMQFVRSVRFMVSLLDGFSIKIAYRVYL